MKYCKCKNIAPNEITTNVESKQFTFKCRARMLELKSNFKNGEKELACSACKSEDETQMHLLCCKVLNQQQPESTHDQNYKMIYGQNVNEIFLISNILKNKIIELFTKYKQKRKCMKRTNKRNGKSPKTSNRQHKCKLKRNVKQK